MERDKARQRTDDAMLERKARAGHVTGGRVFGYDNVEVLDARRPARSTSVRRVDDEQAAVVRRIFALSPRRRGLQAHRERR